MSFVFAISPDHPLAQVNEEITAEHLLEYPSIVVADTSQLLPSRDSGLFMSKQTIRVNNMASKAHAQMAGLGVGFLPSHFAQPYLSSGKLVQKPCSIPRADQGLFIAWNKAQKGKAFDWFIERLCKADWGL